MWRTRLVARSLLCIDYLQTKPHTGWMLFENDVSNYL